MHILLTNDDGIYFPGLHALHRAASALGRVSVVAPMSEQSGVAHSMSILQPLRVREVHLDGQFFGHGVSGAPADCVRLAIKELLAEPPDVVLSGINLGSNAGFCVFYSGTVAGAMEGGLLGIPSMAISLQASDAPDFQLAAEVALRVLDVVEHARRAASSAPIVLNVNIPAVPRDKLRGIRITRQGRTGAEEGFVRRRDPRGSAYYWISEERGDGCAEEGDDMQALQQNYVSVTPLQGDLTNRRLYQYLQDQAWHLF